MSGATSGGPARLRKEIIERLGDFERQYLALETAMEAFGVDFELVAFRRAFETRTEIEAYNRAQTVEHAVTRVQGFVAELAIRGVKLAELPLPKGDEGQAERAFTSLAKAKVIEAPLSRRLKKAQRARNRIAHGYVELPAGQVHATALLVREAALEFIGPFRRWIEQYVEVGGE